MAVGEEGQQGRSSRTGVEGKAHTRYNGTSNGEVFIQEAVALVIVARTPGNNTFWTRNEGER
jgi:hypothetical protein